MPSASPEAYADCVADRPGGAELAVRVVPRAGHDAIAGVRGQALLVRLAAAPVDGAANEALVSLLSDRLGIPRRAVTLVSGGRSRDKRVRITGVAASAVVARLASLCGWPRTGGTRRA